MICKFTFLKSKEAKILSDFKLSTLKELLKVPDLRNQIEKLVDISKELVTIVKSFKPKGFKAVKLNEDTISAQQTKAQ